MKCLLVLLGTLIAAACSSHAQEAAHEFTLEDFEGDTLAKWQSSVSPEYYRGGEGRKGLEYIEDPERGRVMRALVAFVDPNRGEPVWITRFIEDPIPRRQILTMSFWYKITGTDAPPIDSFKLRLRTSPTAFSDYEVLPEEGPPLEQWREVTVNVREGMSLVNVYRAIFGEVQQLTLRLDDVDDRNSEFALLVDDIRVTTAEAQIESYEPTDYQLHGDDRLDVLLITHSTAGYYNVEQAARALDPQARVDTYLFRGLHFPLWGFPASVEELLRYDVIVMVDVDPWVMTPEQATWLADLVHSGAGMVFFGGPNTLTYAKDFKLPLREALPATFETDAKDVGVSALPVGSDHPLAAALPGERLGAVGSVHALTPREGAAVAFTAGEQPLVVCGQFGAGRVALVNAWTQLGSAPGERFFAGDLSDDLMRALLGWAADRMPTAGFTAVALPPASLIPPAEVSVAATVAEGVEHVRLRVEGQPDQVVPAAGDANFDVFFDAVEDSQHMAACALETLDADGEVTDSRDFSVELLNPLSAEVAWARHKYTFAAGSSVDFAVKLARRDLPSIEPSGTSLNLAFAGGEVRVGVSGLGDMWVIPAGTDKVLHDQSGPAEVETVQTYDGLLPTVITTGITRAGREDMTFGDDDRVQRVTRTAQALEDGSVKVSYHYEFLQDVQVSRISTMLTLSASAYAGCSFVAQQGENLTEGELPLEAGGRVFDGIGLELAVETPAGPLVIELLDPSLHVWMQDLRRYGMASFRLEIESPYEGSQARQGDTYDIPVLISGPSAGAEFAVPPLAALSVSCAMVDLEDGEPVMEWPAREAGAEVLFSDRLPDLRSGEYALQVAVEDAGERVVITSAPCYVVDPLDRADFFPIMSVVGTGRGEHLMDEAMIRARVDDLIAHGFNTVAGGNARSFAQPSLSLGSKLAAYTESYAQQQGMGTICEYHRLTLVGRDAVKPCVFDPEHERKLRDYVQPQFDVCRRVPRLVSIKILDEPHMAAAQMDFCDLCRQQFRQRYGAELPTHEEVGEDVAARWRLADFLGFYLESAYNITRRIKEEGGGDFDLLLTFNSPGLGYGRGFTRRQDILKWSAQADRVDFDIYPYFYPRSQKVRMVQCDFGLSMMRSFAQHTGKPWGFYVELDDRNWPYQQNPKEASAECAYTAIAQGADYLNSFIHNAFGSGNDARPERWEFTGQEMRKIARLGPLLTRMQRPAAPVAMIYPMAQAMVHDGHAPAQYALECLRNGFGMMDAVSSEVLARDETAFQRDAFVLLGCEILEPELAEKLKAFVSAGGLLVLDEVPTTNADGEPLELPWGFAGVEATALAGLPDCTYRALQHEKGRVVLLGFDLEAAYQEAVEEDMFARAAALRRGMGQLLSGVTAVCFADDEEGQMEAGLRLGDDSGMVIVVNHSPEENSATVKLAELPFPIGWLCDLATMKPIELVATESRNACSLQVRLPGRHAQMIALLPERPASLRLRVAQRDLKPGERLEYRVQVLSEAGQPAAGCHLVEVEVTGPDGEVVSRFGGATATSNGEATRTIPVPVNALPGEHRVTASAPEAGARARARFTIAQ